MRLLRHRTSARSQLGPGAGVPGHAVAGGDVLFSVSLNRRRDDHGVMRLTIALVLALTLAGCRHKRAPEPEPNNDPYRNVTPAKIKQQVEDIDKKREEKNDKLLEN